MRINSFLSPSYWGSFSAFVIILIFTLIIAISNGVPDYLYPLPMVDQTITLFYCTLAIVFIYLIRHYAAVAVQLYSGSDESIFKLPRWIRVLTFINMVVIIILASVNSFIVSSIGIHVALAVCIIQSVLSLLNLLVFAISRTFKPGLFIDKSPPFKWVEALFLCLTVPLWLIVMEEVNVNSPNIGIEIGFITALVIFFFLHECKKSYLPVIAEQVRNLTDKLTELEDEASSI